MKRRPGIYAIYDDYPENDEDTLYISGNTLSLADMIDSAKDHFGQDVDFSALEIEGTRLHTRCVTYDLYDPADWDDYIIISKVR